MSWLSFTDDYTSQRVWDGMPYETRWMFHCLVEYLARTRRWDGRMAWTSALRCADVPDPEGCIRALIDAGLVEDDGHQVVVPEIEGFLPPEYLRPENLLPRKAKNQKKWRLVQCEQGNHTRDCPTATCPIKIAARVTGNAAGDESGNGPGNAGSGRVGEDLNPRTERSEGAGQRGLLDYGYDNDPVFGRFWDAYPHKVGKPEAFAAWLTALGRGAHPEAVIKAAARYNDDPNRNPAKTKYPQGWLNAERYNDATPEAPQRFAYPTSPWDN